jgi:hypothetical protein
MEIKIIVLYQILFCLVFVFRHIKNSAFGTPDVGIFILLKEMIVMFRDERFPLIGGFPIIGAKYLEMKCVEPSSNS